MAVSMVAGIAFGESVSSIDEIRKNLSLLYGEYCKFTWSGLAELKKYIKEIDLDKRLEVLGSLITDIAERCNKLIFKEAITKEINGINDSLREINLEITEMKRRIEYNKKVYIKIYPNIYRFDNLLSRIKSRVLILNQREDKLNNLLILSSAFNSEQKGLAIFRS